MEPRAGDAPPGREQQQHPTAPEGRGGRRGCAAGWGTGRRRRGAAERGERSEPGAGRPDPPLHRPGGAGDAPQPHGPAAARHGGGSEGLVMRALWSLVLVLQGGAPPPPPDVTARVDRARLGLGEELQLTIRARARGGEAVTLDLPRLNGFLVIGTHELTEVSVGGTGGPVRTLVRELELRAVRAGTLVIGPVRARAGGAQVATTAIAVVVDSTAAAPAAALTPIARALIEGAPVPQRNDRVALTIIVPDDTVLAGQQLDVVAAAWFPRELRDRMHRPPLVTLQTPQRVWAYPAVVPFDVTASRQVRGAMMDLFVAHQVVFPLAAGHVVIPPASVEYAVPATFSFFSREDRYTLQSDTVALTVLPLPAAGRSAGDRDVVARGLTLHLSAAPADARVGEPLEITAAVAGVGNVALWPEPAVVWPRGVRAYPAEPDLALAPAGGRVAGRKTFHYLVVPDSAGTFSLPEIRYPYYDFGTGSYAVARTAPLPLVVAPGVEPRAARSLPPLERVGEESAADALARAVPPWGWALVLLVPPVIAGLARRRIRRSGEH